jgi:hypothetical protein
MTSDKQRQGHERDPFLLRRTSYRKMANTTDPYEPVQAAAAKEF